MNVLLVTSDRPHCGIHEYGEMLQDAMWAQHPPVSYITAGPNASLAVDFIRSWGAPTIHVVHVNHHQAVHASWTPEHIYTIQAREIPVVVTHHDTFETLDILRERRYSMFAGVADHVVIHEPVEGLMGYNNVTYLRQPVLPPTQPIPAAPRTVGSIGFDFPWKGFDRLRRVAALNGWETRIIGGTDWIPRFLALEGLTGCDATAFLHQTGNSGTSGAIRLGIAARRPVIASPCRQFRDLLEDAEAKSSILWVNSDAELAAVLASLEEPAVHAVWADRVRALAERDSWRAGALRYLQVYMAVRPRYRR